MATGADRIRQGEERRAGHALTAAAAHSRRGERAAIVGRVVTALAANLGSIEDLVGGEGSGPAEGPLIRELVERTLAGAALHTFRTAPVNIVVPLDLLLDDLGLQELLQDDLMAIEAEQKAPGVSAEAAGVLEAEKDAVLARSEADDIEWIAAFTETAREVALEWGVSAPVEIYLDGAGNVVPAWVKVDDLGRRLHAHARLHTPLPGSGIPLKNYFAFATAATERIAGRTYRARASAALPRLLVDVVDDA